MLDQTAQLLAANPVAVPVFLATLVAGCLGIKRYWAGIIGTVPYIVGIALVLLFLGYFLAAFFDHPFLYDVADGLLAVEAWLVGLGFRALDAAFFAILKVYLVVVSGLWLVTSDLVTTFVPVLTPHEFLVTIFGFEYLAGGTLIYALYYTAQDSPEQHWYTGIGIVLGISGGFAGIIKADVWQLSRDMLLSGFIAGVLGLALGVTTVILMVQPNFGQAPIFQRLEEAEWWDDVADGVDRVRDRTGRVAQWVRNLLGRED